jgi:peptidyl-dipeptidase Dcp
MDRTDERKNPLLSVWSAPHGLPPFADIAASDYESAFMQAFAEHNAQLHTIAHNVSPATFVNTVAAFDGAGASLKRLEHVFYNATSSHTNEALQTVEVAMSPKMAAHKNGVYLNAALFARINEVYLRRSSSGLSAIENRLVERIYLDFALQGAQLQGDARKRFAEIAQQLASLQTAFSQAVLKDEADFVLPVKDEAQVAGLPAWLLGTAKETAQAKKLEVPYAFNASRSVVEAVLGFAKDKTLRAKMMAAFQARGRMNAQSTTYPIIKQILTLRHEQAKLMGHSNFAHYSLADTMAGKPAAVQTLADQVWPAAVARANAEYAEISAIAKVDGVDTVGLADWRYYAEQLRQQKYAISDDEVKPYFSLTAMTQAMFDCAGQLFGIRFTEKKGVTLHHPDATMYEVHRANGDLQGLFITDNFARPSKRSGAWMSYLREQTRHYGGAVPIVLNTNNFPKPAAGQPSLMGFDDVHTMFHEFGHGLHGLLSDSPYERLSGTNVLQDFVELPSQLFEHWAFAPQVLKKHAKHNVTGAPIPDALIEKLLRAQSVNQGLEAVEATSSLLLDLKLHSLTDFSGLDVPAFEKTTLAAINMPAHMKPRHELAHFGHLFSGDYYASRYYVYLWAEVLDADAYEAFTEAGNPFDAPLAAKLFKHIYSAGNTVAPQETYRAFRGRDATVTPMLRKKGLIAAANDAGVKAAD